MYAVIKTGGKQYRVSEGDTLVIEKVTGNAGDSVIFEEVLMVSREEEVKIGTPLLKDVKVVGEIIAQAKAPKITIFKMKRRKGFHKKTGHRQPVTRMKIKEISM